MIELDQAAALLTSAPCIVALTGAGVSTNSGIGDYRDSAGEWKRAAPVQHQDFMRSSAWRRRYWARSQRGYPEFRRAQPNAAHAALARLEEAGRLRGVITQNVDGLHQRAGQRHVIDLHGRLAEVVCTACGDQLPRDVLQDWLEMRNPAVAGAAFTAAPDGDADLVDAAYEDVHVPDCERCGGILKPHVVFYGDSVPRERVDVAYRWVDEADALLIVGTSLMVFSAFRFVRRAHERGIPIVLLNDGRTRADELVTVKVPGDCAASMAALAAALQPGDGA